MGDVIHVNFGQARNWELIRQTLHDNLMADLGNAANGKERADLIANRTMELIRDVDALLAFTMPVSIEVPPGADGAPVRRAVEQTIEQITATVTARLTEISDAARTAILSAAVAAVLVTTRV
jgi:hypothetical protein